MRTTIACNSRSSMTGPEASDSDQPICGRLAATEGLPMCASKARSKYILIATLVMSSMTSIGMSAQVSRCPVAPQTGACCQLGPWDLVVQRDSGSARTFALGGTRFPPIWMKRTTKHIRYAQRNKKPKKGGIIEIRAKRFTSGLSLDEK